MAWEDAWVALACHFSRALSQLLSAVSLLSTASRCVQQIWEEDCMTFRWLTELMVRTWTNVEEPGKEGNEDPCWNSIAERFRKWEVSSFNSSFPACQWTQHVNELRAGSKVPGFQRCSSGFWAWPKQCITPRPRDWNPTLTAECLQARLIECKLNQYAREPSKSRFNKWWISGPSTGFSDESSFGSKISRPRFWQASEISRSEASGRTKDKGGWKMLEDED